MDIFTQPSSAEFMKLLQPETENLTSENQVKMEDLFAEKGMKKSNRPFQNKMPESINQPLEKEPRVKVVIPKPEPRGEDQEQTDYKSALDGLATLDKQNKSRYFGFYGRDFRWSHNKALNFMKFRKATMEHPCAKLDFAEDKLIEIYCNLFFEKPTPEEYFYQKAIVYSCEDHRLRMKNDECMKERSQIAKNDFNEGKSVLADQVRLAGKNEMSYDNMITDITELFLSGEAIARNPETLGSSSKSLTVLFWNLGNWQRGINFRVPSDLEYQNLFYKEERPDTYPDHVPENNNLFLQMIKNLRAHIVLNCEATTLLPFREYLEKHHWTLCFNDATDLCCLARVGLGGSIRQIGRPNEKTQDDIWNGPKRRVSLAIFEIVWGKAIPRGAYAASTSGCFSREDPQDYEEMRRARMTSTRVCIYHVDNVEAGKSHSITGEVLCTNVVRVRRTPSDSCWWRCQSYGIPKGRSTT